MLSIAGALLGGWILGLFGFKGVVIAGMAQVFGVALNTTGYYFLFGALGGLRSVGHSIGLEANRINLNNNKKSTLDLGEIFKTNKQK